ncbi:hypothetical protein GINT2_000812 [Glugoides intestinalis]
MAQFLFLASLLFLTFYQLKILSFAYKTQIVDFESNVTTIKVKYLQYIGENILHSLIVYALSIVLEHFKNFKLKSISDQHALKLSVLVYAVVRLFPVFLILYYLPINIPIASFAMEMFLIGESAVKIFIFLYTIKVIKNILKEVDICLMTDKSLVQYMLKGFKTALFSLTIALLFDCFSRILYLAVVINTRSKTLMFIKDLGNLLRLISLKLMLESLIDILFTNYGNAKIGSHGEENSKFFVFEEEEQKEQDVKV